MSLATDGFELLDGFEVGPWLAGIPEVGARRGGTRRLFDAMPDFYVHLHASGLLDLACRYLKRPALARGVLFDKTPDSNWHVPWHQDLSLAVCERSDRPGWGPWTVKEGIPHVQPPVDVLEQMVTLRLHLDDCGEENGALRVLPGTHRLGRLRPEELARERGSREEVVCACRAGTVLAMRPLLMHASSPALCPGHRRVVHLEFCGAQLPEGIALLTQRFEVVH